MTSSCYSNYRYECNSYLLGRCARVQEATDAIEAAENYISLRKAAGINLTGPENALDEAARAYHHINVDTANISYFQNVIT